MIWLNRNYSNECETISVLHVVRGRNVSAPHQEGSTDPGEGGNGGEVSGLLQNAQFTLSDLRHFVFEGQLPSVQLQHLDAVQHLVHQLYPVVLALHLRHLRKEKNHQNKILHKRIEHVDVQPCTNKSIKG